MREKIVRTQQHAVSLHKPILWILAMLLISLLVGCSSGRTPQTIPTLIPSVDSLATSIALTENAPPEGYRESISFEHVDQHLRDIEGWHYVVLLEFEGVFSQTNRETSGRVEANVWYNQIGSARRVIVESEGELLQRPEGAAFEAVRLGPDAFLVQRETCLSNVEEDAQSAANISAGELVGGARNAYPIGRRAIVNGSESWEYRFNLDQMNLPAVRFAEDTRVTAMTGEMWVAPEHDVVVRYWVNLNMENARLLLNNLPVTGQLRLRYDLYDIGEVPNITVPFGC